ncbi:hypothetical protein [Streptomyces sp. NPDC090798]|uniref:hypothetical protein n=1 Tax=Streptomyces sp. NPDC090798 TaxID=3365968 RepID=UPI003815A7CE
MTDRHTADTINSDALDQLYDRLEAAETENDKLRAWHERCPDREPRARAEAALARVRTLMDYWAKRTDQLKRGAELLRAALDHDEPTPAATQATEPGHAVTVEGAPATPDDFVRERCPHCPDHILRNRLDEHVATTHADIPPCTATITNTTTDGVQSCAFRANHTEGQYGEWHAGKASPYGRHVWNDSAIGAVPHRADGEQPSV